MWNGTVATMMRSRPKRVCTLQRAVVVLGDAVELARLVRRQRQRLERLAETDARPSATTATSRPRCRAPRSAPRSSRRSGPGRCSRLCSALSKTARRCRLTSSSKRKVDRSTMAANAGCGSAAMTAADGIRIRSTITHCGIGMPRSPNAMPLITLKRLRNCRFLDPVLGGVGEVEPGELVPVRRLVEVLAQRLVGRQEELEACGRPGLCTLSAKPGNAVPSSGFPGGR